MKEKFQIQTLHSTFVADLVTPLSAYVRLREHFPESVLLESADRQGGRQEFSYLFCEPIAEFSLSREGLAKIRVLSQDSSVDFAKSELPKRIWLQTFIEDFLTKFDTPNSSALSFANGPVGFISYDAIEVMEDINLKKAVVELEDLPLAFYRLFKHVLVFDHAAHELHFLQNEIDTDRPIDESKRILSMIQNAAFKLNSFKSCGELSSNMDDSEHLQLIENCKTHIRRGDVFQIVPSRKYFQSFEGDDLNVYRALRVINPSPHLFYYKTKDFCLFGSSPESQIEVHKKEVSVNPIAGTYRRSGQDIEDKERALALSQDPKEVSEHVMLVDLARNDLSVHCDQVKVDRFKEIEFYSHVIHLVSKVSGQLLPDKSAVGAFCSTAPAGTLSGAPKFKAMELLDRYEPQRRHFYGGAIGMFSLSGDVIHAIMIRSFLSRNGVLTTQAGSGVVADSDSDKEVQEVKNKLAGLWAAVKKAESI
jgi:anthranilate synthase component 1